MTAAPPGQVAHHDEGETIATIWVRPQDALARFEAGEIELLPPDHRQPARSSGVHLDRGGHGLGPARSPTSPTILPIVLIEDGRLLVLRPGDDGYEQALEDRMASSDPVSPELAAAAREAWGPKAGPA